MIDKLNHYSFTTPASVIDEEAMTALELAGRVGAKMNETVEAVNEFTDKVTSDIAKHDEETTAWLMKQDEDISYMRKTELPREVRDAIQSNINSGTFTNAINEYAGDLKRKVDSLTENIESGSTTMDAEIISARQDLKTGETYTNLGQSISGQIDRHTHEHRMPFIENLYDASKGVDGMYVSSDGIAYGNASYATSPYIRVKGGSTIYFSHLEDYEVTWKDEFRRAQGGYTVPFLAYYDEKQKFIEYASNVLDFRKLPTTVAYIRFSVPIGDRYDVMCSYFNPYSKFMSNDEKLIKPDYMPDLDNGIVNANLINPAEVCEGYYVASTDGKMYANVNNFATGYIPIKYGKDYALFNRDMNKVNIRMYCIFNRHGDLVNADENVNTFYIDDVDYIANDAPYYVRLSIDNAFLGECMFTYADATKYAEYGEPVIRESALPNIKAEADVDLSQLNSHLGGAFASVKGTSLSFPAHLHNFTVTLTGRVTTQPSTQRITIGDTVINLADAFPFDGDVDVSVIVDVVDDSCVVMVCAPSLGMGEIGLENVDSGDISWAGASVINATSKDFCRPIWVVGDSYMGDSEDRVYGVFKNLANEDNVLRLSRAGLDSSYAYPELVKALELGTPKVLIWYVGLNDTDSNVYRTYLDKVGQLCRDKGITLILNRVPSIPSKNTSDINNVVMNNTYTDRYIDSYSAVNVNDNAWVSGTLSEDGVHPTVDGAYCLAIRMLTDVPEFYSYGGIM